MFPFTEFIKMRELIYLQNSSTRDKNCSIIKSFKLQTIEARVPIFWSIRCLSGLGLFRNFAFRIFRILAFFSAKSFAFRFLFFHFAQPWCLCTSVGQTRFCGIGIGIFGKIPIPQNTAVFLIDAVPYSVSVFR